MLTFIARFIDAYREWCWERKQLNLRLRAPLLQTSYVWMPHEKGGRYLLQVER